MWSKGKIVVLIIMCFLWETFWVGLYNLKNVKMGGAIGRLILHLSIREDLSSYHIADLKSASD